MTDRFKECRHCGWLCMPNNEQSRDWYPLDAPVSPTLQSEGEKLTHDQVEAAYSTWCHSTHRDPFVRMSMALRAAIKAAPTAQVLPEPLPREQIRSLWQTIDTGDLDDDLMAFARAIEAAHGIRSKA